MLTDTKDPNLEIRRNADTIASCNVCGAPNYRPIPGRIGAESFEPTGLELWDLRVSPNGFQTFLTKICRDCLEGLHGAAGIILRGEQTKVVWRK